ncbi:hypothetical protein F5Y15DRAFT_406068 [Xylariaceae sp. FL0016]|nr:hypothetical protein F5Y15DRAFT_406068 [Xylariaceae sp. FL0016]
MASSGSTDSDGTSQIQEWRSIVTLIVFVLANIIVLFPFHIPLYIPQSLWNTWLDSLTTLRIISHQDKSTRNTGGHSRWKKLSFPVNFVTGPLIADLFLLAILAIGKKEVADGIVGTDHISPYDIMIFFFTLAYIAISIDASGLIRYLAFRVLQWGGKVGHRLFFYLYAFFFVLGSFIGNDPIILSGTAFLAYMTRVSSNIIHPRAWIHTQFAIANIASAILVSSNPTNLVLAGAFQIRFIDYTANMIVPVVITVIVLFPFLLYIVFADDSLIPYSIEMHALPEEARGRKPVNPNIPNARGTAAEEEKQLANNEEGQLLSLEEIMNPFLDKGGAVFGAVVMAATLVTLLALNAAAQSNGEYPVFYVTLPAAVVMLCWDLAFGWIHRHDTRDIASKGRQEIEDARRAREEERLGNSEDHELQVMGSQRVDDHQLALTRSPKDLGHHGLRGRPEKDTNTDLAILDIDDESSSSDNNQTSDLKGDTGSALKPPALNVSGDQGVSAPVLTSPSVERKGGQALAAEGPVAENVQRPDEKQTLANTEPHPSPRMETDFSGMTDMEKRSPNIQAPKATLTSLAADTYRWSQETFPTVAAVLSHLPFALLPFSFCMFILVQALVSKGWVEVFAYGWDHWVTKTGTIGSIGGMAFLSVILCNFAGTNIGTTILLSRVIQAWQNLHDNGNPISDRTLTATIYTMALGVNYGAFSVAFSASLAGLLWRDILQRKHITVRRLEFARVNLPIITVAMIVGCAVLTGEVYITRNG